MKTKTVYMCEVCNAEYQHPEMCALCENFPNKPKPDLKVGDLVQVTDAAGQKQKCVVMQPPELMSDVFLHMRYFHKTPEDIKTERLDQYNFGSLHRWCVRVDTHVFLEHGFSTVVPIYEYIKDRPV